MEISGLILLGTTILVFFLFCIIIFVIIHQKKIITLEKDKIKVENEKIKLEKANEMIIAQSVIVSQENERKRIGEDLHDELAPLLAAANLHLKNVMDINKSEEFNILDTVVNLIDDSIQQIRNVSHVLHPTALEDFGFKYAVNDFCSMLNNTKQCHIEFYSEVDDLILNSDQQLMMYRIIQELVINSVKHGKANSFILKVIRLKDEYIFTLFFNGKDFNMEDYNYQLFKSGGLGLKNIQHRLNLLDGSIFFSTGSNENESLRKTEIKIKINI